MKFFKRFGSGRRVGIFAFFLVLGIVAIVAIGISRFAGRTPPSGQNAGAGPPPVPVTAAVAIRQDVPKIIDTIGTVQSIDSVAIQSQVTGPIVKIEFAPGQEVKKGQELFLIDPRPYQAALNQTQAQLAHDQAVLAEAEVDLKRYQLLAQQNSIARQQSEDQTYVVQQDKGTVQVDQANVETAQINLKYCHIAAPVDGRAGILMVDLGNLVGPSITSALTGSGTSSNPSTTGTSGQTGTGSGLVSIAQMKPIYVSFPVPQTQFDAVKEKQAAGALDVEAYSQAGKLIGKGKLTVVDNQVNASTGTVSMQATFANADEALWPGEFVRVELVVSVQRNVVTTPADAVMVGPNGSYVYIVGADQKVHRTTVQVAARRHGIDVIERGISAGDTVVLDGQYRLANGVRVNVVKTTEASVAQR